MKQVIITSKNPIKIEAVKNAFKKMFTDQNFAFEDVNVNSEVSNQPLTEKETLLGAKNRVKNSINFFPDADFWTGIEGGVELKEGKMESFAWIFIKSRKIEGIAKTATFFLPKKVSDLILQGKELGEADDIVFNHSNSKQKNGAVGILTENAITRKSYYTEAVIMALIPFKNPDLF